MGSYYRGSLDFTEVMIAFEKFAPGSDSTQFKKTMYDLEVDIGPEERSRGSCSFPFFPRDQRTSSS